jgi:hypothetical protein
VRTPRRSSGKACLRSSNAPSPQGCRKEPRSGVPGLTRRLARCVQHLAGPAKRPRLGGVRLGDEPCSPETAATELDRAGLSARQIADQLGHSKVSMIFGAS